MVVYLKHSVDPARGDCSRSSNHPRPACVCCVIPLRLRCSASASLSVERADDPSWLPCCGRGDAGGLVLTGHAAIIVTGRSAHAERIPRRLPRAGGRWSRGSCFRRDEAIGAVRLQWRNDWDGWRMSGDQDRRFGPGDARPARGDGRVQVYACTSSLYVWGLSSHDLLPSVRVVAD